MKLATSITPRAQYLANARLPIVATPKSKITPACDLTLW